MDTQVVQNVLNIGFMTIFSIMDLVSLSVSKSVVGIYVMIGLGYSLYRDEMLWVILSILPGVILLIFSYLSNEAIGYGDGMIVVGIGLWTTCMKLLVVLEIAFMAAAFISLLCILKHKKAMSLKFPFAPCLLLGTVVTCSA